MNRDRSWLSLFLLVAPLVMFLWLVQSLLPAVAFAAVFALILDPLRTRLERRFPRAGKVAPLLLTAAAVVLVIIPFVLIAVRLIASAQTLLAGDVVDLFDRIQSFTSAHFSGIAERLHLPIESLRRSSASAAQQAAGWVAGAAGALAASLPTKIIDVFIFVVALYYFLHDGPALVRWAMRLSPFPERDTDELFDSIRHTVHGAIVGQLATSAVQGSLTTAALYVFKVPGALLLGLIATVLSVIPLIGTTPVTLGAAIYLFASGRVGAGIGMIVAAALIGLSDNVVRPWIQSSSTRLHPLLVLLSIFGGIQVLGLVGAFLGPVVAVIALWTVEIARKRSEAAEAPPIG